VSIVQEAVLRKEDNMSETVQVKLTRKDRKELVKAKFQEERVKISGPDVKLRKGMIIDIDGQTYKVVSTKTRERVVIAPLMRRKK